MTTMYMHLCTLPYNPAHLEKTHLFDIPSGKCAGYVDKTLSEIADNEIGEITVLVKRTGINKHWLYLNNMVYHYHQIYWNQIDGLQRLLKQNGISVPRFEVWTNIMLHDIVLHCNPLPQLPSALKGRYPTVHPSGQQGMQVSESCDLLMLIAGFSLAHVH